MSAPRCFWCDGTNNGRPLTRDHLIPVWACRAFAELRTERDTIDGPHRVVKACHDCNFRKGGMPPERFFHLRRNQAERKREAVQWHQTQRVVTAAKGDVDPALRESIVAAMLKPIPGYDPPPTPWTSRPHTKNPPLKRIYDIADFA